MNRGSTWFYLIVFAAAVGFTAAYAHMRDLDGRYEVYEQSQRQLEQLRGERDALAAQQAQLAETLAGLHSDPIEQEAEIRQQGKVKVRDGETVYKVVLADEVE